MHKIVRRVFGTRGAEPCNDPGMLECRMWECQEANTSGLKGACWNRFRGYWQGAIQVHGRTHYLGRFETKEEAHAAYRQAAIQYQGEFARWKR